MISDFFIKKQMDKLVVFGGEKAKGSVKVSGSKNSSLPILAASILIDGRVNILDLPSINDISLMMSLLKDLGVKIEHKDSMVESGYSISSTIVDSSSINNFTAKYEKVSKMRASILVLGPLLSRFGSANISLPGGCAIGARPVNMHIDALVKMGASIKIEHGYIVASAESGLHGAEIEFNSVSVGATENTIMAAVLAKGKTTIKNAAKEPEIFYLADFLNHLGAKITGHGTDVVEIIGVDSLKSNQTYKVPGDRVEAATYAIIAAATDGKLELKNANMGLFVGLMETFDQAGISVKDIGENTIIVERSYDSIKPCKIRTEPYPGFPTDVQAQITALMLIADGVSEIEEGIFENRFMHVPELMRMGADISISHNKIFINGNSKLSGARVMASDLRASASLIIAGLVADGETIIDRVYHLDRGYEFLNNKLTECGVRINRIRG